MRDWIDITMAISTDMAVYPGNDQPELVRTGSYALGADSITSVLTTDLHNGTHVDAPLHFLENGRTIEQVDLDRLCGHATAVDATGHRQIDAELLDSIVPTGTERLLLRTDNSLPPRNARQQFDTEYVALTADASQWVVDHQLRLVGIDYASIELYDDDPETHRTLFRNEVAVLENLILDHIEPGEYELVCLPLLIRSAEAAPARAVLRRLE